MSLTAANLDPDQKQAIMNDLQERVGPNAFAAGRFYRLVNRVGEDAVIDAFLQLIEKSAMSGSRLTLIELELQQHIGPIGSHTAADREFGGQVLGVIWFCCHHPWLFLILGWPGGVLYAACWLVVLAAKLMKDPEPFGGALFATAVGVSILGGVGIGLWRLSPWMFAGTKSWFGWLGSHF